MGAVVVDRQAAAEVEVAHRRAFLDQAGVDAAGLDDAADVADVGDLRAEVVVEQLAGSRACFGFEAVDHIDDLARC